MKEKFVVAEGQTILHDNQEFKAGDVIPETIDAEIVKSWESRGIVETAKVVYVDVKKDADGDADKGPKTDGMKGAKDKGAKDKGKEKEEN